MKQLIALIKVALKSNSPVSAIKIRMRMDKREKILISIAAFFVAVAVLPLYYFILMLIKNTYALLLPIGQTQAIPALVILAGQIFILLFGIYYMLSVFYFSRDMEFLVSLPLKPYQVVFSKYAVILVNEYLSMSFLVLPVLVYYGILAKAGFGYWLRLPIIFLTLPIIPLAISSLLVIVLMRFVNLSKKKDALIILGSILLMALILLPQMLVKESHNHISQDQVVRFFAAEDGLVQLVTRNFPPAAWAARGLARGFSPGGAVDFFLIISVSLIIMAILLVIGEKLFYRSLIGMSEISTAKGKKRLSRSSPGREINSGSHPVRAIFLRELRLMNRTPMFLLNGISNIIIIPALLLVHILSKIGVGKYLISLISNGKPASKILIVAAVCLISGAMHGTASSTFSREGRNFWISQLIPVSYKLQVIGKLLHSLLIAGLGILTAGLVIIILFKLSIIEILMVILLSFTASIFFITIGMCIDISRPLLDWESPQRAMKQNKNVFFAILFQFIILIGVGYFTARMLKAGWESFAVVGIVFLLFLFLAIIGLSYLFGSAAEKYSKIEV